MPEHREPGRRREVRRHPERGTRERAVVDEILDEAMICHIGFLDIAGHPVVIPMLHARVGDRLLIHGSPASRLIRALQAGADVSVAVTLVDGMVLARSVFGHATNYRSVVLFGTAVTVTGTEEKVEALRAFTEKLLPGRWDEARRPSDKEVSATTILAIPIADATAKVRSGPPEDEEDDLGLDVWAGVVPYRLVPGTPEPDEAARGMPLPPSVRGLS